PSVTNPIAHLDRLSYRYPGAVAASLLEVDLEIEPGLTLVTGSSGGGKSTLLRVFDGLVPQFHGGRISGRAVVAGLDPLRTPIPRMATRVGLVFQDVETQSVYGSVEREIAFGLENLGVSRQEMHDRVDEALDELGLRALRERRLSTLSGGERQLVQLAAVLVLRPQLVALDEPTSQLDPEGAAAVLAACLKAAESGRAVVVAEHRLETLLPRADRLLHVEGGRVTPGEPGGEHARVMVRERPNRSRPRHPADACWELRDVSAGPGRTAVLESVSLAGGAGEVVALTGPNGSGKTTLLRTLAGLLPALAGTVGRPPGRTAYLPQNPGALLHQPTLRAEVRLTIERTESDESPDEMLGAFGLLPLSDRNPRDLSSGERQRSALAATLAGCPTLALLDEPTRGMDPAARQSLGAAVRGLTAAGSAVVIATHDSELIAELADRTVELRDGRAREPMA
ncbi:MAG: ABC transporter ATP-binding protein, partial [Candidatus Limnocylindrales bacterium]